MEGPQAEALGPRYSELMGFVDIDPFGEHESRTEESTDEHIPLDPVTPRGSTWDPEGSWALWTHGNRNASKKRHLVEESLKEPN